MARRAFMGPLPKLKCPKETGGCGTMFAVRFLKQRVGLCAGCLMERRRLDAIHQQRETGRDNDDAGKFEERLLVKCHAPK